ncbi:unnamed protein product [Polarella glacialis]|uniref:Phosphoglycolate phosphatase n=1 Tax=Polarella glacialis TaxID=89957 RepID=A0A813GCJ1_POLGL|nr:unnamed protein product [Polarella glacialis]
MAVTAFSVPSLSRGFFEHANSFRPASASSGPPRSCASGDGRQNSRTFSAVMAAGALALCHLQSLRSWRRPTPRVPRHGRARRLRDKLLRPETGIAMAPEPAWCPPGGVQVLSGLSQLVDRYDAFLLDQYGVLHDGRTAYPGVAETLAKLKATGKPSVILSNYAGRAATQREKLPGLGLNPDDVDAIMTSGELAYNYLARNQGKLGTRVLWIAWADREGRGLSDFFDDLPEYSLASNVEDADFVLVSGSQSLFAGTEEELMTDYERDGEPRPFAATFRKCVQKNMPMICANPDIQVVRPGGWKGHLGGSLAAVYEKLGGRVIYFGKPYTAAFEEARRVVAELLDADVDGEEALRICHVGDSLHHDIGGASAVGLETAFVVRTGLHAEDLGGEAESITAALVTALCNKEEVTPPQSVLPVFRW